MTYWQVEHTGWLHPKVLNQTWSTDKLNIQGDSIRTFWTRHEVLTNWTYRHVWFKTFGWNHPVCSSCQYFMSGLKLLDGISLYVPIVCSSCLVQNFWMETPCMFSLSTLNIQGNSIQNCWTRYEVDKLNIQGVSIQKFWTRHEEQTIVCFKTFGWMEPPLSSICQYFMSGSKLLDGITLYIQIVYSSCLVQNLWMETPCMFSKLNIQDDSIQKFWTIHEVLTN
jgi:hypothetical protein